MRRPARIALWTAGGLVALTVVLIAVGIFIARSAWLHEKARDRIVAEVERGTGGRAEIGSFRFDWHTLTAEVAPFVLHGTEPAGSRPLFRAASIRVGLKVVSMIERDIDIQSLSVARPEVAIVVNPDGSTNIPAPRVARRSGTVVEQVLKLAIRRVALSEGFVDYNNQRFPLDLKGEHLAANFVYDSKGPQYRGSVSFAPIHFTGGIARDLSFDLAASLAIDKRGLHVSESTIRMPHTRIAAKGDLLNWVAPAGDFAARASIAVADVQRPLGIDFSRRGNVDFDGRVHVASAGLRVVGRATGRGIDLRTPGFQLDRASFTSKVDITDRHADLVDLRVSALDGSFQGRAVIDDWRKFQVEGEARGISVAQLAAAQSARTPPWEGALTGTVHASGLLGAHGLRDVVADAAMDIAPAETGPGVSGHLAVNYDQRAGTVQIGHAQISIGHSEIVLDGTLGQTLHVNLETKNIPDLVPLISFVGEEPPAEIPVTLVNGSAARFSATMNGPLANPTVRGRLELGAFEYAKQSFNRLSANFTLSPSRLDVRDVAITHNEMQATGSGHVALTDWRLTPASEIGGAFAVHNGDLARLIAEAGEKYPASGTIAGSVAVSGTYDKPVIRAQVRGTNVTAWNEQLAAVEAQINYTPDMIEVPSGSATAAGGHLKFAGKWNNGDLSFDVSGSGVRLDRIAHVHDLGGNLGGKAELNASGAAHIASGKVDLRSLKGSLAARDVTVNGQTAGSLAMDADTTGSVLKVSVNGNLREAKLSGNGEWKLEGNQPGHAQVDFQPVTIATLDNILTAARSEPVRDLPFRGTIGGSATICGPLTDPDQLRGEVRLDQIRMMPNPEVQGHGGAPPDVKLANASPVIFDVTRTGADIRQARFTATDTELEAKGRIGFGAQNPWNVVVTGSINLPILQLFNSDLLASGRATLRATVRGSLDNPQVSGRLELQNASLYLADLPNGVDKANGVILFDRTRATIQRLNAESGGGRISFTGFVGFSAPMLTYRVAAHAESVRYRSPQGASITMDAALDLTGTSKSSIVSGNVTVIRATFNPSTDIGSLLAQAAKPVSTPSQPNEYLRGLQFDIRVESAENLEVQTSLARGLQGQANLHITGTPERPIVVGNLSVNEGVIEFFGNRYTINRGEVHFYSSLKIDPVIDLDLETRVRGVTVDIMLSGPLTRLNLSYRSDPPLKSEQIVALLTVGRTPNAPGELANTQATGQTGFLASGSNALLQQAITAPVTGRLEKFFGVSHIKLDPQLTDITTVPQARLSLEQQISKDVTLTYTTNLARTQEQLIQIEWDLNRNWSVVAVRDENGFFGVDFQYRRRFK